MLATIILTDRIEDTITSLEQLRKQAEEERAVVEWIDRALALAGRISALRPRLPRIFHGALRSTHNYASICHDWQFHAAAASLWLAAFAVDPSLTVNLERKYRYHAACAAAMAGRGQGKDEPPLDDAAKTKLRQQALAWLRADLAARSNGLSASKPEDRAGLAEFLRQWQSNSDLAATRDEGSLMKFPPEEQKAWRALWAEVAAVLSAK